MKTKEETVLTNTHSMKVISSEDQLVLKLLDLSTDLIDEVVFGDESSENAHEVEAPKTTTDIGGLDQTYRSILPEGYIRFHVDVDSEKQNYLTIKLWGSDVAKEGDYATLFLKDPLTNEYLQPYYITEQPELDYMSKQPIHKERFYYATYLIPIGMTKNKNNIPLEIIATGSQYAYTALENRARPQIEPSRGIYKAYIHLDPYFDPENELQGKPDSINDNQIAFYPNQQSQAEFLTAQINTAIDQIISAQKFGPIWDRLVKLEVVPEKIIGAITFGHTSSWNGTEEEWDQNMHQRTIGGNATSLNFVAMLARAYHGQWSNYYHNEELLERVASALDYYTKAQGATGGFVNDGWPGGPNRKEGGGIIEGFGVKGIGEAIISLYAAMNEREMLDVLIDHDNNPNTPKVSRREAYTEMLVKARSHLTRIRGRIANQELANMYAMYLVNEAVKLLTPEEAWSDEKVYEYIYPALGLTINKHEGARRPYTISPKGIGMEGNSFEDRGGYDGNYGPHSIKFASYLSKYTRNPDIIKRTSDLIKAMSNYFNLMNDAQDNTVLIHEEVVSWRVNYSPGRSKYLPNPYMAFEHRVPEALRMLHLYIQHGAVFKSQGFENFDAHYLSRLDEAINILEGFEQAKLKGLGENQPYIQAMIDAFYRSGSDAAEINTKLLNQAKPDSIYLPMEAGAPDFAWADEVATTIVAKNQREKLYMTLNFRGQKAANHLAKVHFTTPTIERIANIEMASPYGFQELYVAKYGDYVIVMNASLDKAYNIRVEGDYKRAVDLISRKDIDLTVVLQLKPQSTYILYLSDQV